MLTLQLTSRVPGIQRLCKRGSQIWRFVGGECRLRVLWFNVAHSSSSDSSGRFGWVRLGILSERLGISADTREQFSI